MTASRIAELEAAVKAAWNTVADEHNSWSALSLDEREDFLKFAAALAASPLPAALGVEVAGATLDTRLNVTEKAGVDRPVAHAVNSTSAPGTAREAPNGNLDKAGVSSLAPEVATAPSVSGVWEALLPCDVAVAPCTIIRKGCGVSTLMLAIEQREGRNVGELSDAVLARLAKVGEVGGLPYQVLFDAIAAATCIWPDKKTGSGITISVSAFRDKLASLASEATPVAGEAKGGPVAWPWDYQQTFNAIAAATEIASGGLAVSISVEKFRGALYAIPPAPADALKALLVEAKDHIVMCSDDLSMSASATKMVERICAAIRAKETT